MIANEIYKKSQIIRDQYAHKIYRAVTVNLSHLASALIMQCLERKLYSLNQQLFRTALYLALKQLQNKSCVFLHESLKNPEVYYELLTHSTSGLQRFIDMAVMNKLISVTEVDYKFLPKLAQDFSVDEIRMENLIAVYSNEVSVIDEVNEAIAQALTKASTITIKQLARLRFNDEIIQLQWDIEHAPKSTYKQLDETNSNSSLNNIEETATADPAPYLLEPSIASNHRGVLLIHGLLASPAELRPFADYLLESGYTVFGVRLKGHGTSPLELATVHWKDWADSVNRGFEILSDLVECVHVVGFSTGGALALLLAGKQRENLAKVVAVCVPVKFKNPNMMLISLLHGVNRFTQLLATTDVIKAFVLTDTEHPHINYRHVPVSALYELRQLIDKLEKNVKDVKSPVALLQSKNDPVVDSSSALRLYERLTVDDATLIMIPASKHGILYQNTEHIWERIVSYLDNT